MRTPSEERLRPLGLRPGVEAGRAIVDDIRVNLGARGVAFSEIAEPASGVGRGPMVLHYDPDHPDGRRVTAIIGDTSYQLESPDWILLPAAAWVNDLDVGVLTAFGRLQHPTDAPSCRLIFNYARAINGTLIGLRLMQADIITDPAYSDMFQYDGQYLLGTGEVAPTQADLLARDHAKQAMKRPPHFKSYILTDAQRPFRFALADGHVAISGRPVYRLWHSLQPDLNQIDGLLETPSAVAISHRADVAENTLLARLSGGPLELDCATTITRDGVRSAAGIARRFAGNDLGRGALRTLETWVRETTVVQIADYENPLSEPQIIESLNPAVYNAVTGFAQVAAFFRYVQAAHPGAWATFIEQVLPARAALAPVTLPTCVP